MGRAPAPPSEPGLRRRASSLQPFVFDFSGLAYRVSVDVAVEFAFFGQRTLFGETDRVFHIFFYLGLDPGKGVVVNDAVLFQRGDKSLDWVAFLILLDFRAGAIVSRIRHRVTHVAISAR